MIALKIVAHFLLVLVDVFKRNAISCPNLNATDSLISDAAIIKQEKESYFYHSDHLGSVGIVTRDGELYDYAIFLPFGEQWVFQSQNSAALNQGTKGEGINPLTPFQFTGKELDKYTGLTYFGARYYDPHTSLWLSPDPIWEEYLGTNPDDLTNEGMFRTVNMNVYNYTAHNPVNMVDPDGNAFFIPLARTALVMGGKKVIAWLLGKKDTAAKNAARTDKAKDAADVANSGRQAAVDEFKDLSKDQRNLVQKFFNGKGHVGLDKLKKNFVVPRGLTKNTLQKYRSVAEEQIKRGKDTNGVQARRIEFIDRALKQIRD